jgi:hypothetical protein
MLSVGYTIQCRMVWLASNELEMIRKETVVAKFEVLSQNFPEGTEITNEKR